MGESTSSGFFSRLFDSASGRTTLVVGVAVGSSLLTAGTMYGLQRVSRRRKRADLADTIRRSASSSSSSSSSSSLTAEATATATTSTSAPRYLSTLAGARAKATEYDESLIREQLSRNYSFLGDEGMSVIRRSFVVVVGAGGVGSWAALMLIRSGVGKLRIIDFDQVSLSSLNRHACAALRDVGRPKVACCADAFASIAPWATVEPVNELFRASEAERLLAGNPDYVVDAIDNIDTKVDLLTFCAARRIKVISSMGAGAKSDPSRVQISDISTTAEDPLARAVRRRLRALGIPPIPPKESDPAPAPAPVAAPTPKPRMHSRRTSSTSSLASGVYTTPLSSPPIAEAAEEAAAQAAEPPSPSPSPSAAEGEGEGEGEEEEEEEGAHYTIPCVFSTEKSDTRLLPLDEAEVARGSVDELAALEDFRVRILPVLGPLPGMFGLAAATYVLCGLGGHALEPLAFKGRRKLYEKMHADLSVSEARSGRGQSIPFSVNDVAYLFEEVFRGRSVVPPHESLAGAQLQRWDSTLPLAYENVALFSRKQAKLHEREVLQLGRSPVEVWGEAAARTVRRRVAAGRISGFFR